LYRQVKRELQSLIESGQYQPGDTLPSESTLARSWAVSIGTLRKAVDELVHEHLLVRRQGKGTYVALHNDDRFLFQFFHVELREDSAQPAAVPRREYPKVDCVSFTRGKADETEAAALRIKPGDAVLRVDNRLSLAGRPEMAILWKNLIMLGRYASLKTMMRFLPLLNHTDLKSIAKSKNLPSAIANQAKVMLSRTGG
jgi:GntR family transcriptional regulator